jgi:hypothetical protein
LCGVKRIFDGFDFLGSLDRLVCGFDRLVFGVGKKVRPEFTYGSIKRTTDDGSFVGSYRY